MEIRCSTHTPGKLVDCLALGLDLGPKVWVAFPPSGLPIVVLPAPGRMSLRGECRPPQNLASHPTWSISGPAADREALPRAPAHRLQGQPKKCGWLRNAKAGQGGKRRAATCAPSPISPRHILAPSALAFSCKNPTPHSLFSCDAPCSGYIVRILGPRLLAFSMTPASRQTDHHGGDPVSCLARDVAPAACQKAKTGRRLHRERAEPLYPPPRPIR